MNKKETLIELRQQIHKELKSFIDGLGEDERAARGSAEAWSIKDEMVHVALWDQRRGTNLQAIGKGQSPTDWGDYNEVNAREYEIHKDDSWDQVEALIERSQETLAAGLELLDEDQLDRSGVLPGDQDRTTWRRIVGSNIMHPMLHMTEYLTKVGQAERALEMILEFSDGMEGLDEGDEWQGLLIYNKSCYYALAGRKPKAIDLLGQALQLNPGLVEWSKEDSDLESLREEPGYQALYSE